MDWRIEHARWAIAEARRALELVALDVRTDAPLSEAAEHAVDVCRQVERAVWVIEALRPVKAA